MLLRLLGFMKNYFLSQSLTLIHFRPKAPQLGSSRRCSSGSGMQLVFQGLKFKSYYGRAFLVISQQFKLIFGTIRSKITLVLIWVLDRHWESSPLEWDSEASFCLGRVKVSVRWTIRTLERRQRQAWARCSCDIVFGWIISLKSHASFSMVQSMWDCCSAAMLPFCGFKPKLADQKGVFYEDLLLILAFVFFSIMEKLNRPDVFEPKLWLKSTMFFYIRFILK